MRCTQGGDIVIGIDGSGLPTRELGEAETAAVDPANLVPQMLPVQDGLSEIASSVPAKDRHTIVLSLSYPTAMVARRPVHGKYPNPCHLGELASPSGATDVLSGDNTPAPESAGEGFAKIIKRGVAARRDEPLQERAAAELAIARDETMSNAPLGGDKWRQRLSFVIPSHPVSVTLSRGSGRTAELVVSARRHLRPELSSDFLRITSCCGEEEAAGRAHDHVCCGGVGAQRHLSPARIAIFTQAPSEPLASRCGACPG